jgi:hypothetical protein
MSDLRVVVHASGYTALTGTSFFTSLLSPLEPFPLPDNNRHALHITLLTKAEAAILREHGVANPFEGAVFGPHDIVLVGLGGDEKLEVSFAVVLVNRANTLRRKAGLPLKDFHITLSTPPSHSPEDFPHDLPSLRAPLDLPSLVSYSLFDALSHHYFLSADYCSSYPSSVSPTPPIVSRGTRSPC